MEGEGNGRERFGGLLRYYHRDAATTETPHETDDSSFWNLRGGKGGSPPY
ncbi:MAG: hypothetical protein OSB39_05420 [Opitutales bacterium]|nr:hypothetical protein [Opitutales bacterium]